MILTDIIKEIQNLSEEERLKVLHQLIDDIAKGNSLKQHNLTELAGLGKEIWAGVDVDQYIRNERNWD